MNERIVGRDYSVMMEDTPLDSLQLQKHLVHMRLYRVANHKET